MALAPFLKQQSRRSVCRCWREGLQRGSQFTKSDIMAGDKPSYKVGKFGGQQSLQLYLSVELELQMDSVSQSGT